MIDYTSIVTNNGNALSQLSKDSKVLLVFLRQLNCVFCREGLKDLAELKDYFKEQNTNLVFVHMTDYAIADMYFTKFKLEGYEHISDPSCGLYQDFGLVKGNFNQLFGLQNIIKGFEATMNGTFIALKQIGDGFQMPGVFLIENSQIKNSFIHKFASDKPDYEGIVNSSNKTD
jgi:peroxiredoxin